MISENDLVIMLHGSIKKNIYCTVIGTFGLIPGNSGFCGRVFFVMVCNGFNVALHRNVRFHLLKGDL